MNSCFILQDAEVDDQSNSRDDTNETHSGADNSQANPSGKI